MNRRAAARYVLIEHQRRDNGGGCHCGWGDDPRSDADGAEEVGG